MTTYKQSVSEDDPSNNEPWSSVKETLATMEVIQYFVHNNAKSLELQYKYEKCVSNLIEKNKHQKIE